MTPSMHPKQRKIMQNVDIIENILELMIGIVRSQNDSTSRMTPSMHPLRRKMIHNIIADTFQLLIGITFNGRFVTWARCVLLAQQAVLRRQTRANDYQRSTLFI